MGRNREYLKADLRKDEGFREETYLGPVTGLPHIGFGHLLGQQQTDAELAAMGLDDELDDWTGFKITRDQAEKVLDIDVDDAIESLAPAWTSEELEELDPERFVALLSMTFQIGGFGIQSKFPSFVKAVKAEDWDRAADEMLWSNGLKKQRRSAWYKQTPDRCQLMADRMRHGETEEELETPEILAREIEPGELTGFSDGELITQIRGITDELERRLGL